MEGGGKTEEVDFSLGRGEDLICMRGGEDFGLGEGEDRGL